MRHLITSLVLIFASIVVSGQSSPIVFNSGDEVIEIGNQVAVFSDSTAELSAMEAWMKGQYKDTELKVSNLGITSETHWVRIKVKNNSNEPRLMLRYEQPTMDEVELFIIENESPQLLVASGERLPFAERKYHHQDFLFDLPVANGETKTFLLKIRSQEQILLPLYVGSPLQMVSQVSGKDIFYGLYAGVILVMIFYNLFVFLSVRDRSYLWYVAYIALVGLTQLALNGYTYRFIWPGSPYLAELSVFFFPSLVGIGGLFFMRNFLNTKKYLRRSDYVIFGLTGIYVICMILALVGFQNVSQQMIQITAMLVSLSMIVIAAMVARKGSRPARFFLLAWTIFLVGVIIFVMKDVGVLPYNEFTNYTMPIGSALEVILLSFGLADRINILKKEKEDSQAKAMQALQENERIVREQNVMLEQKVTERTAELQESNEELSVTLEHLKETQSQLVEAEKMASLGQLTAGIAHEINNPINFVSANVTPLKRDLEDIETNLNLVDGLNADEDIKSQLEATIALRNELDIDYVKEEIKHLLNGIEEGANRTAEIVKGLRVFSRLDEGDKKVASINEGLESTLTLLRTNVSPETNVKMELGDIPDIECYPGKLNQLFMNVMNNALQAIDANKDRKEQGELTVQTAMVGPDIKIEIRDNGTGMTEEVKKRIFEPFYTTKEVGDGTGLGLSIAYKIIENHNGRIVVDSAPGEGTSFNIYIPVPVT